MNPEGKMSDEEKKCFKELNARFGKDPYGYEEDGSLKAFHTSSRTLLLTYMDHVKKTDLERHLKKAIEKKELTRKKKEKDHISPLEIKNIVDYYEENRTHFVVS